MTGKHRRRDEHTWPIKLIFWLLLAGALFFLLMMTVLRPTKPPSRAVTVKIPSGLTTARIAEILAGKRVVGNALTFRVFVSLNNIDQRLQPGSYRFKTGMSYSDILEKLTRGPKRRFFTLVVPEGFTVKQIVVRLAKKTGRPQPDFYEYTSGQGVPGFKFALLPAELRSLEGYLFPKTYQFDKKAHPKKIVGRMLQQFMVETSNLDWSLAQQKNLSKHDIITIASMIETEAKVPEERPLIAAVIYNRLAKNMPLQIDATVQYVLPKRKPVLTNEDLKISSPYNTYQHIGLPPGPISNPGLDSIKAALAPAQVDYLYYVLTSPDGRHTFTRTYEEFLEAKRKAQ